jgi:hypothetical protein
MNFSFLKMGGLPEHEGRANLIDCTLISHFSARKGACQIMLKTPILRTDDPSSQHRFHETEHVLVGAPERAIACNAWLLIVFGKRL